MSTVTAPPGQRAMTHEQWAGLALGHYAGFEAARVRLLSVSENATFLVERDGSEPAVLRLNRPGYHSRAAIESELRWVDDLRRNRVVSTPAVVPTRQGDPVAVIGAGHDRHAVMFTYVTGAHPDDNALPKGFPALGRLTARLHRHARGWSRPPGFTRLRWDVPNALGECGHWGSWRDGLAVGPSESVVLAAAADLVERRLAAYGSGPDRFGLVHADMRLANLLVDGDCVTVIDFDDCGLSWYLYDLAASLSFLEHRAEVPELMAGWVEGYREEAALSAADEALLPTFVMLRRLLLVAWIGSHRETDQAQAMGTEFTRASCALAERFLSTRGATLWS